MLFAPAPTPAPTPKQKQKHQKAGAKPRASPPCRSTHRTKTITGWTTSDGAPWYIRKRFVRPKSGVQRTVPRRACGPARTVRLLWRAIAVRLPAAPVQTLRKRAHAHGSPVQRPPRSPHRPRGATRARRLQRTRQKPKTAAGALAFVPPGPSCAGLLCPAPAPPPPRPPALAAARAPRLLCFIRRRSGVWRGAGSHQFDWGLLCSRPFPAYPATYEYSPWAVDSSAYTDHNAAVEQSNAGGSGDALSQVFSARAGRSGTPRTLCLAHCVGALDAPVRVRVRSRTPLSPGRGRSRVRLAFGKSDFAELCAFKISASA